MKNWFEKQEFFSSVNLDRIEAWIRQESVFIFGEC
jgi:hypothetical protein